MVLKVAVAVGTLSIALGLWGYIGDFYPFSSTVSTYCHSTFKHHVKHLATKSPYVFHENTLYNYENRDKNLSSYIPKGCTAEKIWLVARHGSRQPGAKIITRILDDLPRLRNEIVDAHEKNDSTGQLCAAELEALKSWKPFPELHPSKEKWLVPSGYVELHGIGQRFQRNFPNVFPTSYNPETYKFKFTRTQRAEASAKSFAYGLFGDIEAEKVQYPPALDADPILRFYKACPKWKKQVDKNPEAYAEQKNFEKTNIFKEMHDNLRNRLGFPPQRSISMAELEIMHLGCSFETAWNPNPKSKQSSPWCSVFSENDFQILEYRQDIEYYWIDGYGYDITFKHACAPIRDVMEQFQEKIELPESSHKVTAYFTHSGTILKFLSHLELFRDSEALRADNYHVHKNTRKWRTSFIDKFATNIAFVLFKCTSEQVPGTFAHKIGTLFQEHPIATKFCDEKWICPFDQFVSYFNESLNNCNVHSMCQL